MSDDFQQNLMLSFGKDESIVINPVAFDERAAKRASLVIFPEKILDNNMGQAERWVELSQGPVFCVKSDFEHFLRLGFSPYRFNVLDGYREYFMKSGQLIFFPSAKAQISSRFSWSFFTRKKEPERFHVLLRIYGGERYVYLSSPWLRPFESKLLNSERPARVFASRAFDPIYWFKAQGYFPETQIELVGPVGSSNRSSTKNSSSWRDPVGS